MTLKELRLKRGLTLDEVAVRTNTSASTLSKLERGQYKLKERVKNSLEEFYGKSFEYVEVPTHTEYLKLKKQNQKLKEAINILKDRLIDYQGMKFQKRWYDGEEEYHYFLVFDENCEIELVDKKQFYLLKEVFEDVKEN